MSFVSNGLVDSLKQITNGLSFVYVHCFENHDSSHWVEGSRISKIRWASCLSELSLETKVMDKTMSRLITLKFSEIIFAVFTMLKMNVVIKEIEITMMVFLSLMIFFRIWLMNVDKKKLFLNTLREIPSLKLRTQMQYDYHFIIKWLSYM